MRSLERGAAASQSVSMLTPPQSLEAEQSALGAILIDREALVRVHEFLKPEDFYKDANRFIYEAVLSLYERSEPADLITVTEELRRRQLIEKIGDVDYLQSLMDLVPTSGNVEHYGRIILEKSLQRKLIAAGQQISTFGFEADQKVEDQVDKAERLIFAIAQGRSTRGFSPISDILITTFDHIQQLYSKKPNVTGVSTGFRDLDKITGGFQNSDLVVVAARPSMGKTSLCLNVATHVAVKEQIPVAIISLETDKEQLALRMLCSEASINLQRLRTESLKDEDWQRLARAIDMLSRASIFIDDTSGLSVLEIRSKARRLKQEVKNLGMIIVDYLQLIHGDRRPENRVQEVSEISRGLKYLAKELSVPVVVVSQLNRAVETRNDKRPMLSDLRESGAIEQDADLVMFVYRDDYYNPNSEDKGIAEILISKHRNGPVGSLKLKFWEEYTRFRSLEQ